MVVFELMDVVGGFLHWTLTVVPPFPDGDRDKRSEGDGCSELNDK